MNTICNKRGVSKILIIGIIVAIIILVDVFFIYTTFFNQSFSKFDDPRYDDSSIISQAMTYFDEYEKDVFVERAKNITDNIQLGQSEDEVKNIVGKWTATDPWINEYSYHLTDKSDFYMGNKYTFSFDAEGKLNKVNCYGISGTKEIAVEVLKPELSDIGIAIKKLKGNMNLDEVKDILGDAYLLEEVFINSDGKEELYYEWFDQNGNSALIKFINNKIDFIRKTN